MCKVCSLQRCYQCQWLRWLGNGISSKWLFLHPLEAMEQHRSRNYLLCDVIIVRTNWGKEACFLLPVLDIAANNHSFPCLRKIFEKILHDAVNFFLWWKVMEVWLEVDPKSESTSPHESWEDENVQLLTIALRLILDWFFFPSLPFLLFQTR